MKKLQLKNNIDLKWCNYKNKEFLWKSFSLDKKGILFNFDKTKFNYSQRIGETKSVFSEKGLNCNKSMLDEKDQIISDETTFADTVNKHFVNIMKKL